MPDNEVEAKELTKKQKVATVAAQAAVTVAVGLLASAITTVLQDKIANAIEKRQNKETNKE